METPVLVMHLNQETAYRSPQIAVPPTRGRLRSAVRGPRTAIWIDYALEIEGDTPLTFLAEAVDD
jgi:hypothetical protein